MEKGIKYRPNTYIIYIFGNGKCKINCYPQQKWLQVDYNEDEGIVILERKNVEIGINYDDFINNWKKVE